jgi:3-hydroxyacyl-CoA dehydrogenase
MPYQSDFDLILSCIRLSETAFRDVSYPSACFRIHSMGPLELGDFVGLDICLAIMDVLYKETGDSKYRACPLLRKMVRGGNLGCKTGKGFYVYNADRTKTPVDAQ